MRGVSVVVNTLDFQSRDQGFEPPTPYHNFNLTEQRNAIVDTLSETDCHCGCGFVGNHQVVWGQEVFSKKRKVILIAVRCKTCAYIKNTNSVMCYIKPGRADDQLFEVLFTDVRRY